MTRSIELKSRFGSQAEERGRGRPLAHALLLLLSIAGSNPWGLLRAEPTSPPGVDAQPLPVAASPVQAEAAEPGHASLLARRDRLRSQLQALQALQENRLSPGVSLQSLLDVDLGDEAAVQARIESLRARLEVLEAIPQPEPASRLVAAASSPPRPSGTPVMPEEPTGTSGGATPGVVPPPEAPHHRRTAPGEENPAAAAAGSQALAPAAEASQPPLPLEPAPLATEQSLLEAINRLELERDRLRLRFLSRPLSERSVLLDAEARRHEIETERAAADAAMRSAEEAEQRAEQARQAAREAEDAARTEAARALARELARVEEARSALAGVQADLARDRQVYAEQARAGHERAEDLSRAATAPELTPEEADALYQELVELLVVRRAALEAALAALRSPSPVAPFRPALSMEELPGGDSLERERQSLQESLQALAKAAAVVGAEVEAIQLRRASTAGEEVRSLNALRIFLLPRLTPGKRASVQGLTREGLEQMRRELRQVGLMLQWYPYARAQAVRELPGQLMDLFRLGEVSWTALQALALLMGLRLLRRRLGDWIRALRLAVLGHTRTRALGMALEPWLALLAAIAYPLAFLGFVVVFFALLGGEEAVGEVAALRAIAVGYAWYALTMSGSHHLLTSALGSRRVEVHAELSRRIWWSIRYVGRYALTVHIFLSLSSQALGHGQLYTLVEEFAWLGALPIAFRLLQHWRADIADAYLQQNPFGRLSELVLSSREHWVGILVSMAAFAYVAVRGITLWLRENALQFQQTRKALAFLFRRRLEKHVGGGGQARLRVEALPEDLREAFSQAPASPPQRVEYYPGLELTLEQLRTWRDGGPGAALRLIGERGAGKTTWLDVLEERIQAAKLSDLPVVRHTFVQRATEPERVCALLGEIFGLAELRSPDALVQALKAGPRRIVLLDRAQSLFLRSLGGLEGYHAFVEVLGRTTGHIFWVVSFTRYAWSYLERVLVGQNVYTHSVELSGWDEDAIAALLDHRMACSRFKPSFDDLIVDRIEGTHFEAEVIRTGERYKQLVWDYADGNPRVALHFYLRSMLHQGTDQVRIRLFDAPVADHLESLQEVSRFVLNAIMVHESLTISEVARSLRYSATRCEAAMNLLRDQGYLEQNEGRFWISTHWYRAVLRYLRRKHLIYA